MVRATIVPTIKKDKFNSALIDDVDVSKKCTLCDKNAIPAVQGVANYLKAASEHHVVLYGHQNDLHRKAGKRGLGFSRSDTFDVTGHYAAVNGIDALSIVGTEYGKWYWSLDDRIKGAVSLADKTVRNGSIISLSAHMPNFQFIKERGEFLKDGSINFSGYSPNDLRGTVVADIVLGIGAKSAAHSPAELSVHELYNAYLDMICDFCHALQKKDVGLIWRPFHENTGGWFWWGCNTCTPAQFKQLWQYTWQYFVNKRGVHNLIWAYSPGSEPKTMEQEADESQISLAERYPGDAYVDLVGFDMYQQYPLQKDSFFAEYEKQMKLVADFAIAHKKLWANTETGIAHPGNKALLVTGNEDFDWYVKVLDVNARYGSCYFLLWANFSARGAFYAPYVTAKHGFGRKQKLEGHELLDSFLRMYIDERSVFSKEDGLDSLRKKR